MSEPPLSIISHVDDTEDVAPRNAMLSVAGIPTRKKSPMPVMPPPYFPSRPPARSGRLWGDDSQSLMRQRGLKSFPTDTRHGRISMFCNPGIAVEEGLSVTEPSRQPETRPMPQNQVVAEVKETYAGLMIMESKYIDVDSSQSAQDDLSPKLSKEQWQALIALHRTLLHEHHDFSLASQHPLASSALRRLGSKYTIPARVWRHGIHSLLELLHHRLPVDLEHMLTFICGAYSAMALLYETAFNFGDICIECLGGLGCYEFQHGHKVEQMEFLRTERSFPDDWKLRGLSWTGDLFLYRWFKCSTLDDKQRSLERAPVLKDIIHGSVPWPGPCSGRRTTPAIDFDPFDALQSKESADVRDTSRDLLSPFPLLSIIPRKLLGLAVLAAVAVPVVSAEHPGRDLVTMAWAFGIMANVPSVYVLANPPVPPNVVDGPEEIVWKIARGWSLTFGPVFAAMLVVLLRAILPREKRVAFVGLVFTMPLVAMLLLKLFMRDDTWSVLDMLALCVSFCGVAAYIITTEPMGRNVAGEGLDLDGGRPQYPQANLAINPPGQPPRVPQLEGEADDDSAVAQSSIRTDGPFVIGDDSTLGDGESRI